MKDRKIIRFGVIGCGLMGREFASAVARWLHLTDMDVEPQIVAVCDADPAMMTWFTRHIPTVENTYGDYRELLADDSVDAVYCAVPHHLHEPMYIDIIRTGKHLLAEKPFGIDLDANAAIMQALESNPDVIVRCSSEFPFYPGAYQISEWIAQGKFGKIIEVEAGFWHCSDLDPRKPINWKRRIATNGEYGCMGDLGMHVLHLPLRYGWKPGSVRALLSKIVQERPDGQGNLVPCETWDNAILACDVPHEGGNFPMILSMKRIAPGHANTWFIRVIGTEFSAEFNTKNPKQISYLTYRPGDDQAWQNADVSFKSSYGTITGSIFEFGFTDSVLQMWAAFCDELANGGRMRQPFRCALPQEAADTHKVFTAALKSHKTGDTVKLHWG